MKRKLFTFLVAFLATLSGAVWGQDGTFVLSTGTSSGKGVTLKDGIIKIDEKGKYLIKGDGDTYNYRIETNGSPTITLENVRLETSKDFLMEINIIGGGTVNLELVGENVFKAKQIGIRNTAATNLNILGSSTGFLTISAPMCIGNDIGVCGDVNFNGGTVYLNATDVAIGGTPGANVVTVNENAVLVTTKKFSNIGFEIKNGIVYDDSRKSNPGVGIMKGDVTLKSPLPSDRVGDKAVDLQGNTLTLGSGISTELNQIKETTGTLNAYKVMYADNLDEAWGVKPTNELPVAKYWGANYQVATWDAGINPNITSEKANAIYKQVPAKWWDGSAWIEAGATPNTVDATGIKDVTYGAAWYLAEFNPTYLDTEGLTDPRTLWVPAGASFEWEDTENPNSLAQAGLKIDKNQIEKDLTQPLQKGDYEINLTCKKPVNTPALTCVINATVTSDGYDINDTENVKVEQPITTGEYKGAALPKFGYSSQEIIRVSYKNEKGEWKQFPAGAYQVEYKKEGETSDWNVLNGNLQNVGRYSIRVAGKSPLLKGTKDDVGDFVITPKEVTIGVANMMITAGKETEVIGSFHFVSGMIEEEGNVLYIEANPLDVSSCTEAGTFNVTYTGIKLTANDPYKYLTTNYSVPATVVGQLIVTEDEDGPYDLSKEGEVEVIFPTEFSYSGESINKPAVLAELKVLYGKDRKPASADEYEVSFSLKEGADWAVDPRDVADYKIKVTGKGNLLKGEAILEFSITPKHLSVSANDLWWYQGDPVVKEGQFVIADNNIYDIDKGKVAVSGSVDVSGLSDGWNSDVEYTDAHLTGDRAFNYSIMGKVTGNIWKQAPAPTKPEVKPEGGNWIWSDQLNGFVKVYDGIPYSLEKLHVIFEDGSEKDMVLGSDYTINLKDPIIKDAGNYKVQVNFTNSSYADAKVLFVVTKRPMIVNLKKLDKSTIGQTLNAVEWVESYEDAVRGEMPSIKGTIKVAPRPINGVYYVAFEGLALEDNLQENFKAKNYTATWKYNGNVIDLDDEGNGETGTNIDTGDQGGEGGQQPSKNFCNIYVAEGSSPFIQFNPSRRVVEAVGKITVDVVIPDEIGTEDVKLTFRRGDGAWEALTMDEVTKKYTIKDINTHIYLKAEVDAALLDAEPNENHVYIDLSCTKDGIKLDADREIVENGGDVLIKAEVSKENQNKAIKYEYKVTRFGAWKELKASGKAGEFMIWNVTNDIFVRAYLADLAEDPETAKEAHHVYSDLSVTCEGLYLDADRKMVDNNGTTKVYLTIEPNCNAKNAHYMFRRGIDEAWEELTPSTEANVFVITGIESDIYLKGTDAVPTGTEDTLSETTRVYTQDGMLYVYTAQQEEVSVISMVGAVVKRTQQTGLQFYPLNQGIYVVRVGEQVFKVRVK